MVTDRELVEKWRTHVFRPAATEVRSLLANFPDRRTLRVPFDRYGTDYRFSEPLLEDPDRTLETGRQALAEFARELLDGEEGSDIVGVHPDDRVYFRIADPPERLRRDLSALGADQLNRLVTVQGTVVDVDRPRPRVIVATFRCDRCEASQLVRQPGRHLRRPGRCPDCNAGGPFTLVPDRSTCVDAQTIQLRDGTATVEVGLEHDLVDAFDTGAALSLVVIPRARLEGDTTTGAFELEAVSASRR